MQLIAWWLGMGGSMKRLANAESLEVCYPTRLLWRMSSADLPKDADYMLAVIQTLASLDFACLC